jgi:indoleamine 2,3-dioxygenase
MKTYTDGFFSIDPKNGFLPVQEPLLKLPKNYALLQKLIDEMPIKKINGKKGLLSKENAFEEAALMLPNFLEEVKKEVDPFIIAALYRTYSFITSAYTLAKSHHTYLKTGKYGKAQELLPKNIAQPYVAVSDKLEVFPWLDYHYAYSLGNYHKIDKEGGFNWNNLSMAAKFSGMDDERGFIMLHVDINQYSPDLVKSVFGITQNSENPEQLAENIALMGSTLNHMNSRRKLMWEASRWKHYNDFRVFIMGVKGNDDIFPNGLIYEGVWDKPHAYRGQTGAQDNIIPTADIASGVIHFYPQNQLTKYLMDLRQYRPKCVQQFFKELASHMQKNPLIQLLSDTQNEKGMQNLMHVYEEIYLFRNGHWQFVQKYIMQNTAYPKATGGTPITSWIPNQIKAVLKAMKVLSENMKTTDDWDKTRWKESYDKKMTLLNKQLEIVAVEAFDPNEVFKLNLKFDSQDF